MSLPYITRAGYPISINSQDDLAKVCNLGTQIGFNNSDRDSFVTMTYLTPSTYTPKVFYVKGTGTYEGWFTAYAVVNKYDTSGYLCWANYDTSGLETTYGGNFKSITSPGSAEGVNDIWYANIVGATNNIMLDKLNPSIPVFDTLYDGLQTAKDESWVWRDPDDPYEFDDSAISYAGGGKGTFDNTSDTIGVPSLPTLSAVSAGFIAMYSPTLTQLNQLANFLWTDSMFDPDNFKKLFTDPMECIIGLTIVPVAPPSAGSMSVSIGYVNTGITMPRLSSQYAEVNCGTIKAEEFWGNFLDYSPNTKISLYLPYVGIREINTDEVMNKSIGVVYHVDLLSGALTAFVTANGNCLYQFNGQCALNIPLAASNFTQMIQGAITSIGAVASTIATGGTATGAAMGLKAVEIGANAANNAINNKPTFSHSGSMGGAGGMLGIQTPYLIINRPNQSVPSEVNKFAGFPSNIKYNLFDLEGFTQVEYIHLENIPATSEELNEIESLLKEGVIL